MLDKTENPAPVRQQGKKPVPPRFQITPISRVEPRLSETWLIKHLLPAQGLAVIYGPPGGGKSFVALDAAFHIAMGREWAGKKVREGAVIYIAAEGGYGFDNRIVAARTALQAPDDTPLGLIKVAPNLGTENGDGELLVKEIQAQIYRLEWGEVVAIFVDTLARTMIGADENSAADMGRFVRNIDYVSKAFHCLAVAVHHTGKDADKGMRGSSALHGAADAEWEIGEDAQGKTIRTAKQKDGADDLMWHFALIPQIVGVDEDSENVSSCVVQLTSEVKQKPTPKNVSSRRLKGQKAELLKAVTRAIEDMGEMLPASSHMPAHTRGTLRNTLERYTDMLGFKEGTTERVQRSSVDRMLRDLAGDGYIGRWGKHIWLVHETDET